MRSFWCLVLLTLARITSGFRAGFIHNRCVASGVHAELYDVPKGFSRGDAPAPPSKNRKPKPKPDAQRPKVRVIKSSSSSLSSLSSLSSPASAFKGRVPQDVDPDSPCGCGSGSMYSKCCGAQHMGLEPSNTPEQVLRARYTAFKYGLADYIIESSHPACEDYVKYMVEARASKRSGAERWKREIVSLHERENLGYLGLEVVSSEVKGDVATVIFRAVFLQGPEEQSQRDSKAEGGGEEEAFYAVEERSVFVRAGGKWLYQEGETDSPDEEIGQQLIERFAGTTKAQSLERVQAQPTTRKSSKEAITNLPGAVSGAGGKAKGLVPDDASEPRAPWLNAPSQRKQASGGLSDKGPIRPFASGRA